jgi:hypothetical protein
MNTLPRPARSLSLILLVLPLSSACVSGLAHKDEGSPDYVVYAGEPVDTARIRGRIDGWRLVSRNQLVIETSANEAWLLKVWDTCRDLTFAYAIDVGLGRFNTTVRVADTVGVADITLLVEDERCKITEIRAVDVKQMKADRRAVSAAS